MDQEQLSEYVKQSAALMGLTTNDQDLQGVVVNFVTIATIAHQVMEFPLPENLDAAPEFHP